MATKLLRVFVAFAILQLGNCDFQAPRLCDAIGESSEECDHNNTDVANPRYFLYHDAENPDHSIELFENDLQGLVKAAPHRGADWKVLIHGFTNNGQSKFPQNVKNAYLKRVKQTGNMQYNVLVVDWGDAACVALKKFLPYNTAADNTKHSGQKLGDFIKFMHDHEFAKIGQHGDVHLIGFSLGAHVAGEAGHHLFKIHGDVVKRTTGLDPAGPDFWGGKMVSPLVITPKRRLHRQDTWFADIIHTSAAYGTIHRMGDVDFYVNKGKSQPSCVPSAWMSKIMPDFLQVCSHNYATHLFAKSINDNSLVGCMCDSYFKYSSGWCTCKDHATFGEFVSPYSVGTFYIDIPREDDYSESIWTMMKNWMHLSWSEKLDSIGKGWEIFCKEMS